MMNRRWAWAIGAFCGPMMGVGCHADGTTGASSTEAKIEAIATPRGTSLVGHAQQAFRVRGATALAGSPIERFTAEAGGFLAEPLIPRGGEPVTRVHLPSAADGAIAIEASGMRISVRPRGFSPSKIEWGQHVAVYPDVAEGTHAFRRVDRDGVEDFYQVDVAREELSFSYDVATEGVAGLRVVEGNLELLDASGAPRLAAPAPMVVDAHGATRLGKMSVRDCAYDTSPIGPWGRPVVAPGKSACIVVATIDGRGLAYPVLVDPAWKPTFNTKQTHAYHKLLTLPAGVDAGKVLLVGGTGSAAGSTELFDPASGTWASSSTIADLAQGMNAVVLTNGTVVVAGGLPSTGTTAKASVVVRTPAGVWSAGSAMSSGRAYHTMNVIKQGGKELVLVAGGQLQDSLGSTTGAFKSSELYDPSPSVDAWKGAGAMGSPHTRAASSLLADGRLLVTGGNVYTSFSETAQKTADIFDPAAGGGTGAWLAAPAMVTARANHVAVTLGATGVLVAGGVDSAGNETGSIELFDGTAWKTVGAKLVQPRQLFAANRLADGRVLFTGGQFTDSTFSVVVTDMAEIFAPGATPTTGTEAGTVSMGSPRRRHASTATVKGILVTGGETSDTLGSETSLSELFDTTLGKACALPGDCPSGTFCTEGVCCSSASCPEGQTCTAPGHEGVCTKPQGARCTSGGECATGNCASGYCCDTVCTGSCKTCDVPGKLGICTNALAGTDPGGLCAGSFGDPTCGTKCDGSGFCGSSAPRGTACGSSLGGDGGVDGGGSFCSRDQCDGFGGCNASTFDCGLTCTSSVTCSEATKTCTPSSSGIKAGYCVIDSKCWSYGDLDPKDPCNTCNPPVSKTTWTIADTCDGGVTDTGVDTGADDTGAGDAPGDSGAADTGSDDATDGGDASGGADTGPDDTGAVVLDSAVNQGPPDLPSSSTCGCRTPGDSSTTPMVGSLAALGLVAAITARRRRR